MTHHRFAIASFAAIAMLAVSPSVALAASPSPSTYQAVNPSLTVSSASVAAGGSVTISGVGYDPNETINITVVYGPSPKAAGAGTAPGFSVQTASFVRDVVAAHAAADANGAFSQQVTLSHAGAATITATGAKSGRTSTSTVNVMAAAAVASGSRSLFSGDKLLLLAGIPVLVLIVSLVFAIRGRRPSSIAPANAPVVQG